MLRLSETIVRLLWSSPNGRLSFYVCYFCCGRRFVYRQLPSVPSACPRRQLNVLARLDIVVRNRRTRLPTYVVRCEIAFTRLWLSKAVLRIGFDAGLDLFVHISEENMYPGYCHDDEGMLYRTVGCQNVCAA